MVVIIVLLAVLVGIALAVIVAQAVALRHSHERVHFLLEANKDLEDEGAATRLVLGLAMNQHAELVAQNHAHETSLLLVLGELERVS